MSLKSFINNEDVKKKVNGVFKKPELLDDHYLMAPPLTENYSIIKTAFMYLLRFKLQKMNPNMIDGPWIAEWALEMAKIRGLTDYIKKASKILDMAKNNVYIYMEIENKSVYKPLIESALYLAQMDSFFTEGSQNIVPIDKKDINDLEQLIALIDDEIFESNELCIWNPMFGEASRLVGGAEADLILDDMIIEIKTDENIQLKEEDLNILWGYYTLFNFTRPKGMKKEDKIKKVGIYFARHSYLYKINIDDYVDKDKFPEFLEWFDKRANEEFL